MNSLQGTRWGMLWCLVAVAAMSCLLGICPAGAAEYKPGVEWTEPKVD